MKCDLPNPLEFLPIIIVGLLVFGCYGVWDWALGLCGVSRVWTASAWLVFGGWGCAYWPLKYRENMKPEDWRSVAWGSPVIVLSGPFSFLLGMPV